MNPPACQLIRPSGTGKEGVMELAELSDPAVRVFAQTLPGKNASIRVLEKLGFERSAEIDHPEDGRGWEWEPGDGEGAKFAGTE